MTVKFVSNFKKDRTHIGVKTFYVKWDHLYIAVEVVPFQILYKFDETYMYNDSKKKK